MVTWIKALRKKHPDLYEFILFNLMSNVATITNFCVLWLGNGVLFHSLQNRNFSWFIFKYTKEEGGIGGFWSFLLAYVCAQIVNFLVQRRVVFHADGKVGKVLPWYIFTVSLAGILSVLLPPHIIGLVKPYVGTLAPTVANIVNIVLQVLINYPMMKFVVMKR